MSWNYRVIRREHPNDEVSFSIHEVYYTKTGKIDKWTVEPIAPCGDSLAELLSVYVDMSDAFKKPKLIESKDKKGKDVLIEWEGK